METFEGIRYRLLGPVELYHEGEAVDLSSTKVRLMPTALALAPNTVVSFDALGKVLWERGAPPSARSNVRTYATNLRRVLDRGAHHRLGPPGRGRPPGAPTRPPGPAPRPPTRPAWGGGASLLPTAPDELDAQVFPRLAEIGRRALAD